MLNNSLYTVHQLQVEAGIIVAGLTLNPAHPIFAGHFPARPVLPGVCLMQMIKEILASHLKQELVLTKADYVKFIQPVIPTDNQQLDLQIKYTVQTDGAFKASATLTLRAAPYFKFQGYFRQVFR